MGNIIRVRSWADGPRLRVNNHWYDVGSRTFDFDVMSSWQRYRMIPRIIYCRNKDLFPLCYVCTHQSDYSLRRNFENVFELTVNHYLLLLYLYSYTERICFVNSDSCFPNTTDVRNHGQRINGFMFSIHWCCEKWLSSKLEESCWYKWPFINIWTIYTIPQIV